MLRKQAAMPTGLLDMRKAWGKQGSNHKESSPLSIFIFYFTAVIPVLVRIKLGTS
jgi:hypothetical protein